MYELETSRVEYSSGECVQEDLLYREDAYSAGKMSAGRKQREEKKEKKNIQETKGSDQ